MVVPPHPLGVRRNCLPLLLLLLTFAAVIVVCLFEAEFCLPKLNFHFNVLAESRRNFSSANDYENPHESSEQLSIPLLLPFDVCFCKNERQYAIPLRNNKPVLHTCARTTTTNQPVSRRASTTLLTAHYSLMRCIIPTISTFTFV